MKRKYVISLFFLFCVLFALSACKKSNSNVPTAQIKNIVVSNDYTSVTFQIELFDKSKLLESSEVSLIETGKTKKYSTNVDVSIPVTTYSFRDLEVNHDYTIVVFGKYEISGAEFSSQTIAIAHFSTYESPENAMRIISKTVLYTGEEHQLEIKNLPTTATVTWYLDNQPNPSCIEVGVYFLSAEVRLSNGSIVKLATARLEIVAVMPNIEVENQIYSYTGKEIYPKFTIQPLTEFTLKFNGNTAIPKEVGTYDVEIVPMVDGESVHFTMQIVPIQIDILNELEVYPVKLGSTTYTPRFNCEVERYEVQFNGSLEVPQAPGVYDVEITVPGTKNYYGSKKKTKLIIVSEYQEIDTGSTLLLSEIIFGPQQNYGIELYNPTKDTIALKDYKITIGNEKILFQDQKVLPNATYTIVNKNHLLNYLSYNDLRANLKFNPNTPIQLYFQDTLIDSVYGEETKELGFHTYLRRFEVVSPSKTFHASEWLEKEFESYTSSWNHHEMNHYQVEITPSFQYAYENLTLVYGEEVDYRNYLKAYEYQGEEIILTEDMIVVGEDSLFVTYHVPSRNGKIYSISLQFKVAKSAAPVIEAEEEYLYQTGDKLPNFIDLIQIYDDFDHRDSLIVDIDTGTLSMNIPNIYPVVITVTDSHGNKTTQTIKIIVGSNFEYATEIETLKKNGPGLQNAMPSIGNTPMLVIPIAFSEHEYSNEMLRDLSNTFFGIDDGFESVQSFYDKSSYRKLLIKGTIFPWYEPKREMNYYTSFADGMDWLLFEALQHYGLSRDYSTFDSDKDGFFDSIFMVHNLEINPKNNVTLPFTKVATTNRIHRSISVGYYSSASYYHLQETINLSEKYNARTYIHEIGHQLGLEDYADYNLTAGPAGGLGGSDMMDTKFGDHNPMSKLLLGWVIPKVITNSTLISITPSVLMGEVLIIPKKWNGTIFSEFLLIDYYTEQGLNLMDQVFSPNHSGIRIYHVNAEFSLDQKGNYITNGGTYWSRYHYDNSDTEHKFIKLLEADYHGVFDIERGYGVSGTDLFQVGEKFGQGAYADYTWVNGSKMGIQITVRMLNLSNASLEIKMKQEF